MDRGRSRWRASDGVDIGITCAGPAGGPAPGLVIFPSIFGVTGELEAHVDDLAASGALVVAFDPFARGDAGGLGEAERERAMARMAGVDFGRMTADFRELLAAVRSDAACNTRVAALGICLGGPFALAAAADGELDALATWHGSRMGGLSARAADVRCPALLEFGDADPVSPMAEIEKLQAAFRGADQVTIRVHPGATHGFSHTGWSEHDPAAMGLAVPSLKALLARLAG